MSKKLKLCKKFFKDLKKGDVILQFNKNSKTEFIVDHLEESSDELINIWGYSQDDDTEICYIPIDKKDLESKISYGDFKNGVTTDKQLLNEKMES